MATLAQFKSKPKYTVATLKSFVKNFGDRLYIKELYKFDGMIDGIKMVDDGFKHTKFDVSNHANTLGYTGIWIVGGSGNFIKWFEDSIFSGFEVSNCCGNFIVAVKG